MQWALLADSNSSSSFRCSGGISVWDLVRKNPSLSCLLLASHIIKLSWLGLAQPEPDLLFIQVYKPSDVAKTFLIFSGFAKIFASFTSWTSQLYDQKVIKKKKREKGKKTLLLICTKRGEMMACRRELVI